MTDLPTFLFALTIAYVIPGPDFAFVMSAGRHARAAALGVITGLSVHATLAAAGVSSLLAATSWGLPALRVLGGAFLLYAGVSMLRGATTQHPGAPAVTSARAAWRRGLLGNLLNPKTLLFFLALLPQFVDVSRPVLPQVTALSAITVLTGVLWWTFVVGVASKLTTVLERPRVRRRLDLTTGVALLGLAGLVAVA